MVPNCYSLISCDKSKYPDIISVSSNLLSSYIGRVVSLNGDSSKRYTVKANNAVAFYLPDSASQLCGYLSSHLPRTYEFSGLKYNGVSLPIVDVLHVNSFNFVKAASNTTPLPILTNCGAPLPLAPNATTDVTNWVNSLFLANNISARANVAYFDFWLQGAGDAYEMVITIPHGDSIEFKVNIPAPQFEHREFTYVINSDGSSNMIINGAFEGPYPSVSLTNFCKQSDFRVQSVTLEDNCTEEYFFYRMLSCRDKNVKRYVKITDDSLFSLGLTYKINGEDDCYIVEETKNDDSIIFEDVYSVEMFSSCEDCVCEDSEDEEDEEEEDILIPLTFEEEEPNVDESRVDEECLYDAYCNFASFATDDMNSTKYGISICCTVSKYDAWINKELVDLKLIDNRDECKPNLCCPPECVIVELVSNCDAPSAAIGMIVPIINNCLPPTTVIGHIVEEDDFCFPPNSVDSDLE